MYYTVLLITSLWLVFALAHFGYDLIRALNYIGKTILYGKQDTYPITKEMFYPWSHAIMWGVFFLLYNILTRLP